jgi:hypothetical protein
MRKIFFAATGLILIALPAFGQSSDETRDHGSSYDQRDRDLDDLLRGLDGGTGRGTPSRGAGFLLRTGDAVLAVRCDPRGSMRDCVDATTILLERARSALPPSGGSGGPAPGSPPRSP